MKASWALSGSLAVSAGIAGLLLGADAPGTDPKPVFKQYCFQCHGDAASPTAGVSLTKLTSHPVGDNFQTWQKVSGVLEQNRMPPKGMPQPTEEQRKLALNWVHTELTTFANKNAGDPGRVTVRRLTSGEYGYTINDLTGLDLDIGRDFANDSVGGEGFMNFGDVQFMQDASLERYLETAKLVADHAVIGSGPIEFYTHPGKTGFELSAISRIKDIYATQGFRTVSGEGGDSFGLEKYRKAFYVAWRYQHRAALGEPTATIKDIAAREGISARFSQHILTVMNAPSLGFPVSEVAARFRNLPATEAEARKGCADLETYVTTWPSWLFGRGDKAVGGAGDESPLVFTDAALKAEPLHHFNYNAGGRAAGRGAPAKASTVGVYMNIAAVTADTKVQPVVIWRNATVMVRKAGAGRGAAPVAEPAAEAGAGDKTAVSAAALKARANPAGPRVPLKEFLGPDSAAELNFGTSPDGSPMGPNDFATVGTKASLQLPLPEGVFGAELQVDAAIGMNHEQVVRVSFSNRADGPPPGIPIHALLGDTETAGYRHFKAGVLELVADLPPNSNSEPTPADKDPPPLPFDPTFNTPEHDAFDTQVKYHRDDRFIAEHVLDDATRLRLDRAWADLYSSFDYHDEYLDLLDAHFKLNLKSKKMADLTMAQVAAMPAEAQQYVKPLRSEYLEMVSGEAAAQPRHVEDCVDFAAKAWRRPLTDRDKENLRAFYRQTLLTEKDHVKAVRALIARILVSPDFLYRVEQPVNAASAKPLSSWEMASRMSYFIWSSIPDDELRRAASTGELNDSAQVTHQVRRMLADPKARRMSAEFFGQWLGFYRFDQFKGVDTGRFPEFTDGVRSAMYDEAVSFFEYIVRSDRPNREILSADYDFMNKTLADYYGVKAAVKSTGAAEKVDGANAFERGGALRLGAVLTTTSAPLRTSPVKRGDWILRRILNTPTPPPPADAGSIPADDKLFGGLSLHDKLEAHKRNPTCATCHTRIDPLGFPLENYDSTGRWRTQYADGKPIYNSGTTFDKVDIQGTPGLLKYLQDRDAQFRKTLAIKMTGYALGRTVAPSDLSLIEKLVNEGGNAPFSQLVTDVVTSRQFRNRLGREDSPAVKTASATPHGENVKQSDKAGTR